ncbi:hypothetical protein PG997_013977 [Apiospora hydei]|uniref:GMC oxidoreductase n=1 Tax=Apiospora hydei TaxID=1337664 RepID=A0ABR1V7R5_9PEZI
MALPLSPSCLHPTPPPSSLSTLAALSPPGAQAAPILDDLLGGIGGGLLNPLASAVKSVLSGEGLVQGVLGALEGALGVDQTYDYVVVGGGTAGNAVGYRLAEAGHSVAIVEAGLFYEIAKPVLGTTPGGDIIGIGASPLDSVPTVDWQFITEPQAGANGRRVHYARGKCLGGSSALNFMIHQRGSKGSYDKWADEVGDDSYRLDALTPYFQKSVTLMPPNTEKRRANASTQYDPDAFATPGGPVQVGYTNWVSVWATWLERGLQAVGMERTTGFSSGQLLGYHYSQSTIRARDQTRSTSAEYIYQAKAKVMEKLKVYTQTMASKILFDDGSNKKNATGVRVSSLGIEYTINARKEVILSAGTFQSPQLLMRHWTTSRSPVVADLPGVGQNMWDHIMFGPAYEVAFDTLDRVLHDPVVLAQTLAEYVATQSGPLTSNVVEFIGWEKLPAKYRDTFSPESLEALKQFPDDWPEVEHISGNGFIGDFTFPALQQPLDGKQYATNLGAMVAPLSRGNVTLRSASTRDLPLVSPNWLTAKADQDVAVAWYRRMREVWATDELKSIRVGADTEYWPGLDKSTDAEILDVIRDSLMTVWHAVGTCKMGRRDDDMAVIDNKARSTIYALAEKIADEIIKDS